MDQAGPDRNRIPEFDSIEEEAEFWDTHSLTEFEDEFEPVEIEVARPLGHVISVKLESDAFHRLYALARRKGMSMFGLAQQ